MRVSGLLLKFEYTPDFEMLYKTWHSIEEVPYYYNPTLPKVE